MNWTYGDASNWAVPQKDLQVRLRSAQTGGAGVAKVTYHTAGKTLQDLAFAFRDNAIHVIVPEVELWGVLRLRFE